MLLVSPCKRLVLSLVLITPSLAAAEPQKWEIGLSSGIFHSTSSLDRDQSGLGIALLSRRNEHWAVGFGLDRFQFDRAVSEPVESVASPAAVSYKSFSSTSLAAWVERRFPSAHRSSAFFVTAGFGYAVVSAEGLAENPSTNEFHLNGSVGHSWQVTPRWSTQLAAVARYQLPTSKETSLDTSSVFPTASTTLVGLNLTIRYQF